MAENKVSTEVPASQTPNIVNLTPHILNVVAADGSTIDIKPSGQEARISTTSEVVGEVDGITIFQTKMGAITGLPEPVPGKVYITSLIVAQAAKRADVLSPGLLIRKDGQPVGCKGFARQG